MRYNEVVGLCVILDSFKGGHVATTHFRLTAVLNNAGMVNENIFYCHAEVATPPAISESVERFYTPLTDYLQANVSLFVMRYSLWEGPAGGEWWEIGPDGKKHPKAMPPWGVDIDLTGATWGGGAAGQQLPPFVTGTIIGKTNVKRTRARKFVSGFVEDNQNAGGLDAGAYSALQAAANAWLAGWGGGMSPSYVSETWGPIHGFNDLISVKANAVLGSMNLRKIGRGI